MAGGDGALEAALREIGGARAAIDPRDLWADRSGIHAAQVAERATVAALGGVSWRAFAALFGDDAAAAPAASDGKTLVMHAAFDDVDGDGKEDGPIADPNNNGRQFGVKEGSCPNGG